MNSEIMTSWIAPEKTWVSRRMLLRDNSLRNVLTREVLLPRESTPPLLHLEVSHRLSLGLQGSNRFLEKESLQLCRTIRRSMRIAEHQIEQGFPGCGSSWRRTGEGSLPEDVAARRSSGREPSRKALDEGMVDPLLLHTALRIGNVLGELACEVVHPLNDYVRIKAVVLRHSAPVAHVYIVEAVFAAKLHR